MSRKQTDAPKACERRQQKIQQARTGKFFAFGDIFVFAAALLLIAAVTAAALLAPKAEEGSAFTVYYRNTAIFSAPLDEDGLYLFRVQGGEARVTPFAEGEEYENGNVIEVADGKVCVREADCPAQDCVFRGKISAGEILCLPHEMRISVHGGAAAPPTDY